MLGSLRDKMSHLQEGLVGTIIPPAREQNKKDKENRIAEQAGADVLFHFQNCWEKLHVGAEQCARQADRCDRLTSQVHAEYDKRWRHVAMLSSLVEGLPEMNTNISDIIQELRHMEIIFSNVELALQNLEETIHAQETREKQQQLRFDMRVYEEKRKHELSDLEEHLKIEYDKSLKDAEARENQIKVERQSVFQQQFQQDLQTYQSTGFLDVPLVHNIDDVALESINLSGDETELEDFLNSDSNDLYSLTRSRTPTQSHLAVPGRKRTGKCLSGPAGIQSSSGASNSGTAHLKPTGEKPIIKKKGAIKSGPPKLENQQQNKTSVSPGLSAISLAQEVSSNTVEATAATLFAAGSMGVEMTAALGSAAGSIGNVAAGSIGNAAVGISSAAGNIGNAAAGSIGTAAGTIGSTAGTIGYAAAGSIGSAAGTIGSTAGNVAAGTLGCAAGLGSAAVDLTAATLNAANQGINIGDDMMTDVIITSVVDPQSDGALADPKSANAQLPEDATPKDATTEGVQVDAKSDTKKNKTTQENQKKVKTSLVSPVDDSQNMNKKDRKSKTSVLNVEGDNVHNLSGKSVGNPSGKPSAINPASNPAGNPSVNPTSIPAINPAGNPSVNPASNPVDNPAGNPAGIPAINLDSNPAGNPSVNPAIIPAINPAGNPAGNPGSSPLSSPEEGMKSDGSMYFTPSQTMDNIKLDD